MTEAQTAVTAAQRPASLVSKLAEKYNVEPEKLLKTLKDTVFKLPSGYEVSNEQMLVLLSVANKYNLDPMVREIYAFPAKGGGVVPIVGFDGWISMMQQHPQYDGHETIDGPDEKGMPAWIECRVYRKDRSHPTVVREYMIECKRSTEPWTQWPRRMLRIKATIQAARVAFGFAGIYDPDEGERIVYDGTATKIADVSPAIADINNQVRPSAQVIEYNPEGAVPSMTLDANGQGELVKAEGTQDKASEVSRAANESKPAKGTGALTAGDESAAQGDERPAAADARAGHVARQHLIRDDV